MSFAVYILLIVHFYLYREIFLTCIVTLNHELYFSYVKLIFKTGTCNSHGWLVRCSIFHEDHDSQIVYQVKAPSNVTLCHFHVLQICRIIFIMLTRLQLYNYKDLCKLQNFPNCVRAMDRKHIITIAECVKLLLAKNVKVEMLESVQIGRV